jgi:hypothetical protein
VHVQYRRNAEFEIAYDSNPRDYFDDGNGLVYRLNNHGFRGPDFAARKPSGTRRIAVLGDSFTFGEGVRWQDTFAKRVQDQLRVELQPAVEVLNLGHSMWGTSDEIHYLAAEGRRFAPDLVLMVYVLNDATYAQDLDLYNDFRGIYEPGGLLRRSYFLSYLKATVGREIFGQMYLRSMLQSSLEQSDAWDRSLQLLARGRDIASAMNSRYAVVIFPFMYKLDDSYPFSELHDLVSGYAATQKIPVLDLLPSMLGEDYASLWVHPSDPHPNDRAHAIASAAISDFVVERGLLDRTPGLPSGLAAR